MTTAPPGPHPVRGRSTTARQPGWGSSQLQPTAQYCEYRAAPQLPLPRDATPEPAACHYPQQGSDRRIPPACTQPARHTGRMAKRFSVQADTRDECVEGLEQLVQLDLVPVMLPVQVGGDRWMARAVPRPPASPAEELAE